MKKHPDVAIKDHSEPEYVDECGYCGTQFAVDEIVIEKNIHGRRWRFCSQECYKEFLDAANFKDEEELDREDRHQGEDSE